jgi:Uma2 family endonuclease
VIVRGDETNYRKRHPGPTEIGLLVEISDSSLMVDRDDKGSIYTENGIPVYWVVNVVDKLIEVYTQPSGPTVMPAYARRRDYPIGSAVPVAIDGVTLGNISVVDVLG